MIVRLFRCQPVRAEFDAILRDTLIPDMVRLPGLVDVHVGRHGPDTIGDRLIASIWESDAAMVGAMGTDVEASLFHPEHLIETTDRVVEVHALEIAVRVERPDQGRVMRLARGTVRAGELGAYVEDARAGTLRDAATESGPLALYLAALPPDRFVTLSIWTDWASIEASTGAGTRAPGATRHAERLVDLDVAHFEVVPR